jgi:MinD-like ATPase involved in chromosome partitioning or flagellar assembly
VELPTYTSIWRIEKRLYKLYDFRLPMPLPVGQIAVFTAVTVPYIVLLTLLGLPFNHSLFWLYVLPPGLLTWLATRPVLESKRLPELLISQTRYLGEPSTWCRMAPLAEKDQIVVFGRVWRRASVAGVAEAVAAEQDEAAGELAVQARPALPVATPVARPVPAQAAAAATVPAQRARGRGRLIRERHVPDRQARAQAPAAPPARPPGTPVAGAGWARDAGAGTWRDPGLAGPAGNGRHAGPARPPAPVGYATGEGARPGSAVPGSAVPGSLVPGGAAAGGAAASDPAKDSGAGRDVAPVGYGTGADAGTGWPVAGYARPASARPGDPAGDSGRGQDADADADADEGAGRAGGTGWPVGYPPGTGMPPGAPVQPASPAHPAGPGAFAPDASVPGADPRSAATQFSATPASSAQPSAPDVPGRGALAREPAAQSSAAQPAAPDAADPQSPAGESPASESPAAESPAGESPASESPAAESPAAEPVPPRRPAPVVIVPAQRSTAGPSQGAPAQPRPAPGVERALSGPGDRPAGWRSHVTVVPGGRGPGRPDHVKEARARAVLPLDRPRLVVVLGCTVGAGQTVTALMLADLLAGLRGEPVAALDLNPGPASLTELARVPAITVSALLADRAPGAHAAHSGNNAHRGPAPARGGQTRGARTRGRLDVICQDAGPEGSAALPNLQQDRLVSVLASRYPLTLADPGAPAVAKLLAEAGQLVLVAPASPDAARAVSMTCEWLGGHGHAALAQRSIAVLNGVSQRTVRHAEQAELVLRGRCRAIVRVPWDDHLAEAEAERGIRDSLEATDGPPRLARLRPAVLQAYTALAGVLVSSLADDPVRRRAAR